MSAIKRDFENQVSAKRALVAATYTTTTTGDVIDTQEHKRGVFVITPGTRTDGTHTPSLLESDDNSTYSAVAAADITKALVAITSNTVQAFAYQGGKRYLKLLATVGGATTGAVYSATYVGLLGRV